MEKRKAVANTGPEDTAQPNYLTEVEPTPVDTAPPPRDLRPPAKYNPGADPMVAHIWAGVGALGTAVKHY